MRNKSQSEQRFVGMNPSFTLGNHNNLGNNQNFEESLAPMGLRKDASPPINSKNREFGGYAKVAKNSNMNNKAYNYAPKTAPNKNNIGRPDVYTNNSSDKKLAATKNNNQLIGSSENTNLDLYSDSYRDDFLFDSEDQSLGNMPQMKLRKANSNEEYNQQDDNKFKNDKPLTKINFTKNKEQSIEYCSQIEKMSRNQDNSSPLTLITDKNQGSTQSNINLSTKATGKNAPKFFFPNDTAHNLQAKFNNKNHGMSSNEINDSNSIHSKESSNKNRRKIISRNPLDMCEKRDFHKIQNKNFNKDDPNSAYNINSYNNTLNPNEFYVESEDFSKASDSLTKSKMANMSQRNTVNSNVIKSLEKGDFHSSVRDSGDSNNQNTLREDNDLQKFNEQFLKTKAFEGTAKQRDNGAFFNQNNLHHLNPRSSVDVYAAFNGLENLPEKIERVEYLKQLKENAELRKQADLRDTQKDQFYQTYGQNSTGIIQNNEKLYKLDKNSSKGFDENKNFMRHTKTFDEDTGTLPSVNLNTTDKFSKQNSLTKLPVINKPQSGQSNGSNTGSKRNLVIAQKNSNSSTNLLSNNNMTKYNSNGKLGGIKLPRSQTAKNYQSSKQFARPEAQQNNANYQPPKIFCSHVPYKPHTSNVVSRKYNNEDILKPGYGSKQEIPSNQKDEDFKKELSKAKLESHKKKLQKDLYEKNRALKYDNTKEQHVIKKFNDINNFKSIDIEPEYGTEDDPFEDTPHKNPYAENELEFNGTLGRELQSQVYDQDNGNEKLAIQDYGAENLENKKLGTLKDGDKIKIAQNSGKFKRIDSAKRIGSAKRLDSGKRLNPGTNTMLQNANMISNQKQRIPNAKNQNINKLGFPKNKISNHLPTVSKGSSGSSSARNLNSQKDSSRHIQSQQNSSRTMLKKQTSLQETKRSDAPKQKYQDTLNMQDTNPFNINNTLSNKLQSTNETPKLFDTDQTGSSSNKLQSTNETPKLFELEKTGSSSNKLAQTNETPKLFMENQANQKVNPQFCESDAQEDYDPFLAFEKKVAKGGTGDLNRISKQFEQTKNFDDNNVIQSSPKQNTTEIGNNYSKMRESKSKFRIKRASSLCDTDEKNQMELVDNAKKVNQFDNVPVEFNDQSFNQTDKEDQFNITFRNQECTSESKGINSFKNTLAQTDTNLGATVGRTGTLDLSKPSLQINKKNKFNVYNLNFEKNNNNLNFDHLENPLSNKEKSAENQRSNKKNLKIAENIEYAKDQRSVKTPNPLNLDRERLVPMSKNNQQRELNERLKLKSHISPVKNDSKQGSFIKNQNIASYKHLNQERSNVNSASKHFLNRNIVDRNFLKNNEQDEEDSDAQKFVGKYNLKGNSKSNAKLFTKKSFTGKVIEEGEDLSKVNKEFNANYKQFMAKLTEEKKKFKEFTKK